MGTGEHTAVSANEPRALPSPNPSQSTILQCTCMYTCVCAHAHTHAHTNTCTYTLTHTFPSSPATLFCEPLLTLSLLRLAEEPPRLDTDWGYSSKCDEEQLTVSPELGILEDMKEATWSYHKR